MYCTCCNKSSFGAKTMESSTYSFQFIKLPNQSPELVSQNAEPSGQLANPERHIQIRAPVNGGEDLQSVQDLATRIICQGEENVPLSAIPSGSRINKREIMKPTGEPFKEFFFDREKEVHSSGELISKRSCKQTEGQVSAVYQRITERIAENKLLDESTVSDSASTSSGTNFEDLLSTVREKIEQNPKASSGVKPSDKGEIPERTCNNLQDAYEKFKQEHSGVIIELASILKQCVISGGNAVKSFFKQLVESIIGENPSFLKKIFLALVILAVLAIVGYATVKYAIPWVSRMIGAKSATSAAATCKATVPAGTAACEATAAAGTAACEATAAAGTAACEATAAAGTAACEATAAAGTASCEAAATVGAAKATAAAATTKAISSVEAAKNIANAAVKASEAAKNIKNVIEVVTMGAGFLYAAVGAAGYAEVVGIRSSYGIIVCTRITMIRN